MSNKPVSMAAVHCEDALNELERHQFLLNLFFDVVESLSSSSEIQPYCFNDLVMLVDIYQRHNQEAISNLKLAVEDLREHLNL